MLEVGRYLPLLTKKGYDRENQIYVFHFFKIKFLLHKSEIYSDTLSFCLLYRLNFGYLFIYIFLVLQDFTK